MFEKTVKLLREHIKSLKEIVGDKTGVITQYTKDKCTEDIEDYERGIFALEIEECKKPSTNTQSTAIAQICAEMKDIRDAAQLYGLAKALYNCIESWERKLRAL